MSSFVAHWLIHEIASYTSQTDKALISARSCAYRLIVQTRLCCPKFHSITNKVNKQGGGTPIDSVLRAATAVKILTDKIFIIALH